MTHLPLAVFGLVSILALAACSPSGIDMSTPVSESGPAAHGQGGSGYRTNPQPKQAYRVTMTIAGAPGPFASMRALAQYDVVNKECLRPPKDNPGGHTSPVPSEDIEIALTRVSDNEYSGIVYADYMQDEDYNGRGVCRWQLMQFRVHMKATGADGETLFIPSIPDENLLAGKPEIVYFNRIGYPGSDSNNFPDTGLSDRSRFGPSIQDGDLFTVTFTPSKEAKQ
jgi:hypothetical protein